MSKTRRRVGDSYEITRLKYHIQQRNIYSRVYYMRLIYTRDEFIPELTSASATQENRAIFRPLLRCWILSGSRFYVATAASRCFAYRALSRMVLRRRIINRFRDCRLFRMGLRCRCYRGYNEIAAAVRDRIGEKKLRFARKCERLWASKL